MVDKDIQRLAQQKIKRALRKGEIVRPDSCERCGNAWGGKKSMKPHAAHIDYARPLDVVWLCPSCHARWDANRRSVPRLKEIDPDLLFRTARNKRDLNTYASGVTTRDGWPSRDVFEVRQAAGLTQVSMSEMLEISQPMLSQIESGKKKTPRDVARRLVQYLEEEENGNDSIPTEEEEKEGEED